MSNFDYSTINLEALRALPLYRLPRGNHLQEDPGNGCAMDAPGYPTYFTRSVYNSRGDELRNGPYLVITDPDDEEKQWVVDGVDLRTLWLPLPTFVGAIGRHPRLKLWEQACYIHWNKCYQDVTEPENNRPGTLIWPIPGYALAKVAPYKGKIEVQWFYGKVADPIYGGSTLEWKYSILGSAPIETKRQWQEYIQEKMKIATPENHEALRHIQSFYPNWSRRIDWITNPPTEGYEPNNRWWERYAQPHTSEEGA